jgi:hypothetical protein
VGTKLSITKRASAFDQVVRRLIRLAPDPKTRAWLRAILYGDRGAGPGPNGEVSNPGTMEDRNRNGKGRRR